MVESTFSYLAAMAEKPVYWITEPPPGTSWRNTRGDHRVLRVENARELVPPPTLDDAGFTLAPLRTAVADLYDPAAVRTDYYREMERLVEGVTGAARVLAFDHNVRSKPRAERREDGAQGPVRFVHNDYTERSGPQRVRDLLGDEAEALLRYRRRPHRRDPVAALQPGAPLVLLPGAGRGRGAAPQVLRLGSARGALHRAQCLRRPDLASRRAGAREQDRKSVV